MPTAVIISSLYISQVRCNLRSKFTKRLKIILKNIYWTEKRNHCNRFLEKNLEYFIVLIAKQIFYYYYLFPSQGITWGKAFLISPDDKAALPYLSTRECKLGGYRVYSVNFHSRSISLPSNSSSTDTKTALLYIAVPENKHWLGSAPLPDIAKQILECHGSSGSNVEYLLRLADFMRMEVPEALDEHLFSLERLVWKFAADMKICLRSLMGDEKRDDVKPEVKAPSFQFASRIPDKKLRCVNM